MQGEEDLKYFSKQDQVNNANSAFILINCLVSSGLQSSFIGPGGPGDLGGQGGPGSPGGPDLPSGPGGLGVPDGQGGQVVRGSGGQGG